MDFKKLNKIINEYVDLHKTLLSSTEIANLIKTDYPDITTKIQPLSLMVYTLMTSIDDPKTPSDKTPCIIVNSDGEKDKYQVVDDIYIWESKKAGIIKIPVSQADTLFFQYSKHGLDLSQENVRRKHSFSIPQWNSIKSTLWLYKESNIFSPYTVDNTPDDKLQEMISSKFEMKYVDKNRIIEDEYRKHTLKEYKKVINEYQTNKFITTEFLYELNSLLPEYETINVNNVKCDHVDIKNLFVAIADLHVGAKTIGLRNTPDFDLDVLIKRLDDAAIAINKMKSHNVTLAILGDIIESFTGLNHQNSWKSMEFGVYGAKAVFAAYNILSDFFGKINNLKNIKIIGGNHDRSTSNSDLDRQATIAELLFFMLNEKYNSIYNLEYDSLILTHDLSNTRLILAHGDKKIIKKNSTMIDSKILDYGCRDKFNMVLTGHLHSRKVNEDKSSIRWYSIPSIFSGNFYSEENGWNAKPGMTIIHEDVDMDYLPIVIDYPLR